MGVVFSEGERRPGGGWDVRLGFSGRKGSKGPRVVLLDFGSYLYSGGGLKIVFLGYGKSYYDYYTEVCNAVQSRNGEIS